MRIKLCILLACWTLCLWAERIPEKQARKIATEFFQHNKPQLAVSNLRMVLDGETPASRAAGVDPAFYVYNNPNGKGFVIISGDDIAQPVLGYSFENEFLAEQLPEHIEGWMESLKKQINDGRKYGVASLPNNRSLSRVGEVVVKLETAQWDQGTPYNQYSPTINGETPPTGCTITAGAIVMKFHQWPKQGTGTIPGYTTDTHKIAMPAIELGHTYEWSKMPDIYKTNQYSKEQAHQVARLMADLGTMVKANYNLGGTGADPYYFAKLFPVYMDYDKSALFRYRYVYSDSKWHELMKAELQQNRPVIYSGYNEESGHCFVLDGYTSDDFYSVNWGWGGYCNGYFLLNALVPRESGTGGNNDHYNFHHAAVTNLMPDQGGNYIEDITLGNGGLSSSTTTFERHQPFQLSVGSIDNRGWIFYGKLIFALTDKKGNIKEELNNFFNGSITSGGSFRDVSQTCTITVPIEIGDRIRVFYQSEQTPEWTLVTGDTDTVWELLVADEFSIDETTSICRNKLNNTIVVTTKDGVSVEWVHSKGTSKGNCYETVGNITTIHTENLPAGDYLLKLKKTFESHEVKIKL